MSDARQARGAESPGGTSDEREGSPSRLARMLPILEWAPRYQRLWLRSDLIAGLAVAALVVPKSLGYAGIAGVPIQHGLFAATAGAIIYALFGTARRSRPARAPLWRQWRPAP